MDIVWGWCMKYSIHDISYIFDTLCGTEVLSGDVSGSASGLAVRTVAQARPHRSAQVRGERKSGRRAQTTHLPRPTGT